MSDTITLTELEAALGLVDEANSNLPDPEHLGRLMAESPDLRELVLESFGQPEAFFTGFQIGYLTAKARTLRVRA